MHYRGMSHGHRENSHPRTEADPLREGRAEGRVHDKKLPAGKKSAHQFRDVLFKVTDIGVEPPTLTEQAQALAQLNARLDELTGATQAKRPFYYRYLWSGASVVAAALLVVLGWSSGFLRSSYTSPKEQTLSYITANGQRATVTLPDGSVVTLNVGSQLELPAAFHRRERTVRLSGEAFFTVTHNTGAPFTVLAGPAVTRVLGTSFVVRHYTTDTVARVMVRDGKVAVGSTVLTAMQEAVATAHGVSGPQLSDLSRMSFTSGVLTLTDMRLPEAIVELNRWYNANIQIGDSTLFERGIGGTFASGSLDDLAANLEWTFNLRVVRTGRTLTLYAREL
jgi:transmembrane sensor